MQRLVVIGASVLALGLGASPASAQYFGKNKVQYKQYRWKTLQTPHFDIYYYEREAIVARDAARLAERAYGRLSRRLGYAFDRRIPVVLYASHSDFQQTHITPGMIDTGTGGVTELAKRRVFLPFTGSYAEFEHVLTHELVHAFQLEVLLGGRAAGVQPLAQAPPLWFMEGMAEFLSKAGKDSHTAMWMRDASLSGYLIPLDRLAFVGDIRVYRFGQSFFQFFATRYGIDKVGGVLKAMASEGELDAAFRRACGQGLADLSEAWTTWVRRRHLGALAEHRLAREFARPVATRRQLRGSMFVVPAISPDGAWLAYVGDEGLTRDLFVQRLGEPQSRRRLLRGRSSGDVESLRFFHTGIAWSPDARTLAVAAQASGQDALYLLDARTGRRTASLSFGFDEIQAPSFSPDGEEILFVALRGGRNALYRVRRDGSQPREILAGRFAIRDPQWSPDGRHVVYVTDEGPQTDFGALRFGRMHLALLDLDTGERRDITPFATGKAIGPVWSGDGESIAFLSDRDGRSNVYVLHLPTGNVFRVTDVVTGVSGVLESSPAITWAREADVMVFGVFQAAGWDLYAIDTPQRRMRPVEMDAGTIVAESAPHGGTAVAHVAADVGHDDATVSRTSEDVDAVPLTERPYRVRLSPDLSNLGGVVGYDTGVGGRSRLTFTDMLGDHALSLGLGVYGSLRDSDLEVSYLDRSRRMSSLLQVFQYKRRFGFLATGGAGVERQTYRGVRVLLARPSDRFRRLEVNLQVAGVDGRFLDPAATRLAPGSPDTGVRMFVGAGLAWVHDTAIFGSTGPLLGMRTRLGIDTGFGQLDFATLRADVRRYWNWRRRYTLAVRAWGAASLGRTPETFYLGGAYTLRGFDYGALAGRYATLVSAEFRFPLIRRLALGWPLPLEMGGVRGALFADVGSAWDGTWMRTTRAVRGERLGRRPQVSFGWGARIPLGAMILRLDWARRYDSGTGELSPGTNVSLGADF